MLKNKNTKIKKLICDDLYWLNVGENKVLENNHAFAEELFQRHNSMYEAFLTRNPYTIEEAVRAHYTDSAERLAQICEAEQKPKTARSQRRAHFPTE